MVVKFGTVAWYDRTGRSDGRRRRCFFHSILGADSSYELGMRCSLARWIHMDEGYNTMALDLDYVDFEN